MDEAISFLNSLISLGYEETLARDLSTTALGLLKGISKLIQTQTRAGQDDDLKLSMGVRSDRPILQHDDRLLPYWSRFTEALSSVAFGKHTCITLSIQQVQLGKEVMEMILQSLKKAPVDKLYLSNNILGNDGYSSLVELFNTNTSLKTICIDSNLIESDVVATKFINVVVDHPNADNVALDKCEIGKSNEIMKAVLPLLCLNEVSLEGNHIDSYGAELISDCLATNPTIQRLYLRDNLLNDADAKNLSESLKTNTNLRMLDISLNAITREGKRSLALSVIDPLNLNSISESNHTCLVKFTEEEDVLNLRHVNIFTDSVLNKNLKLIHALKHGTNYLKDDTPLHIIPRVLALLGTIIKFMPRYKLDGIFGFIKEWNMPLLYTSRLGKEPRRSKRIRKKIVMKYMGNK